MTPRTARHAYLFLLVLLCVVFPARASSAEAPAEAMVATIAASINPVTADYLSSVIEKAEEQGAALIVVELDTPGGLDSAMRQMVQEIIKTKVPVAVYVSP